MSPAHTRSQGRGVIVLVVLAVLVGLAVASHSPGVATLGGPPVTPGSFVSAAGAESSSWYCTGQSTPTGKIAVGSLIITNSTGRSVTGSITSSTETGAVVQTSVTVPAHDQLVPDIAAPSSGSWTAQSVILSSGGVAVTQSIHGPAGWSEAPCASRTAQSWYFATGDTSGANGLFLSVFNPTSSPDVVDMAFTTPTGVLHPVNFQGLVLQPGQVQVANVSAFVQEQSSVSTTVTTRTGRVVASEVEQFSGAVGGLALVPGVPQVASQWTIPQSDEVAGGLSALAVFNPGTTTESVTVNLQLASGPVAPLQQEVPPHTTWALPTSIQTRLPKGDPYVTEINATGGAGVVVGRLAVAPTSAVAPRAGAANAIDPLTSRWPSHQWLVPSPGSTATPANPEALPEHLALANTTAEVEHYTVVVFTPQRTRTIATGTLLPHHGRSISGSTLFGAGLYSLVVRADGPLSVSEDVGPSGTFGVITMPGLAMDK